ncbi:MAG: CheR family methyltransferase [Cyclobacteriaceae bacterium]
MDSIKENKILSANLFPVVGIGASAGGLDAFKQLIKTIPEQSGMAYILVQHLDPLHESVLSEILQRLTRLPVHEIQDNVKVESDHIYIIPSNKMLVANDGVLKLSPRPPKTLKYFPINVFFKSLSEIHQDHAIGVVLSGTGSDGTLGLKAIKEQGGVTFAQDMTAAYDGMPLSAIDTGVVDFILPPDKIMEKLLEIIPKFRQILKGDNHDSVSSAEEVFKKILIMIRVRNGVDFTYYKQSTIQRRIMRRMAFKGSVDLNDYLNFLRENKPEQDLLYQDLLIPVTSFFRDPQVFDDLCHNVFPEIIQNKSVTNPLRIWVAGCSTGEEAYSIAICLHEKLAEKASSIKIQIFATDISEISIAKARAGIYGKNEVDDVSEARLKEYFNKVGGKYQVTKTIRDLCLFAHHNFLKNPPFSKVDLISCRNVLIYMQPFLQKKAFATFHYALNDRCFLMLGKSENIAHTSDLFMHSKFGKVFIKKPVVGRSLSLARAKEVVARKASANPFSRNELKGDDFQKNVDDIILFKYSAVGVIVNEQLDIVQFRGATGAYLEAPAGKTTLNVLKMARENLSNELRTALHKAKNSNEQVIKDGITFDKGRKSVSLEVIPLRNTIEPYFLILFQEENVISPIIDFTNSPETVKDSKDLRIAQLEKDLGETREDMRTITEEQEAANEELQSANEELLSGSEELQSLNEELETTKEEIQSTNEELIIVNQELYDRNEQLMQSRQFAEAVVSMLHEPLLILNKDLRIVTANQSFYKIFKLREEETTGRILFELQNGQWDIPILRSHLFRIQTDKSKYLEWEVACTFADLGERHLCFNAQPIERDKDNRLILLAIDDITLRKKAEQKLKIEAVDQKIFSEELEKQIHERTLSLKKTNIELERSIENLNQFAFIASHDLQEPLRKIQVFSSLLAERFTKELSDEAKKVVRKISSSTSRMSRLINDVLNFSTILSVDDDFVVTDLKGILKIVLKDLDFFILEKHAVINIGNLPVLKVAPVLINQLFNNLISNSLKFSKTDATVEILITSRTLLPEEIKPYPGLNSEIPYCEITIKDNGIGFHQNFAEQIFIIFQRLNTRYPGTGIGLTLCKKIVNYHNGVIRAESSDQEGASFYVILPLMKEV